MPDKSTLSIKVEVDEKNWNNETELLSVRFLREVKALTKTEGSLDVKLPSTKVALTLALSAICEKFVQILTYYL